jgi:hypothetical protein
MKLLKIIGNLNQIEKSSFLKILDSLSNEARQTNKEVDAILSDNDAQIKNVDDENIVKLFFAVRNQYKQYIQEQIDLNDSQLQLICSILTRDGNSIMSRDWLRTLYRKDLNKLTENIEEYKSGQSEIVQNDQRRNRDYDVFRKCVAIAYTNDSIFNRENNITKEEKTILNELAKALELSNDEKQLIYYSQVPLNKLETDDIISLIKDSGIAFYCKRELRIYVPDEIVQLLREILGISLPNKYFRRILRKLNNSQITRICRKHGINSKLEQEEKITAILESGVCVENALLNDIHPDNVSKTDIKNFLASLIEKLDISLSKSGSTAEERLELIINYFNQLEYDDNISISLDGFERLLIDMADVFPVLSQKLKDEFELQQDNVLDTQLLLDYCIKPLDIVYLLSAEEIKSFCENKNIKTRGTLHRNIIENYRDIENLYLENLDLISSRDINGLKDKGLEIKEAELGLKFEELTKRIFSELGFDVNEELRNSINTSKDKMDLVLHLGSNKIAIVECKTVKDKFYNKYSSSSRQLKSYVKLCKNNGFDVAQVILVANDFSDDFVDACEDDFDLHVTLISANTLVRILDTFKQSAHNALPFGILKKGGLLNADRICKSLLNK